MIKYVEKRLKKLADSETMTPRSLCIRHPKCLWLLIRLPYFILFCYFQTECDHDDGDDNDGGQRFYFSCSASSSSCLFQKLQEQKEERKRATDGAILHLGCTGSSWKRRRNAGAEMTRPEEKKKFGEQTNECNESTRSKCIGSKVLSWPVIFRWLFTSGFSFFSHFSLILVINRFD